MNKHNNSNQYQPNYKKEYNFNKWKDEEDAILRAAGVPEEKIAILRVSDHEDMVNSKRRDELHKEVYCDDDFFNNIPSYDEPPINDLDDLLDQLEDETLIYLIRHSPNVFKDIIWDLYEGYAKAEIAEKYHISYTALGLRIHDFKKKYKKSKI